MIEHLHLSLKPALAVIGAMGTWIMANASGVEGPLVDYGLPGVIIAVMIYAVVALWKAREKDRGLIVDLLQKELTEELHREFRKLREELKKECPSLEIPTAPIKPPEQNGYSVLHQRLDEIEKKIEGVNETD